MFSMMRKKAMQQIQLGIQWGIITDTHQLDVPANIKKFLLPYDIDVKTRLDTLEQQFDDSLQELD